jgi:hypothetical protein
VQLAQTKDDEQFEVVKAINASMLANSMELIKAVLLIQGGACVALLAFLAATLTSDSKPAFIAAHAVMPSLQMFGYGSFWCAMSLLAEVASKEVTHAYFERRRLTGVNNRAIAILVVVMRIIAILTFTYCISFAYGGLQAADNAYSIVLTALREVTQAAP